MKIPSLIVLAVAAILGPGLLAAEEPAPSTVETCDDVDAIVKGFQARSAKKPVLAGDDRWTESVISVSTAEGVRTFRVSEGDIGIFLQCWDLVNGEDPREFTYQRKMPNVISDLFPLSDPVAEALTSFAGRAVPVATDSPPDVLNALELLAIGPEAGRRRLLAPKVTEALREQWWSCWANRAKQGGLDAAIDYCNRGYAQAVSVWRYGLAVEEEAKSLDRELVDTFEAARDPQIRQIAVMSAEQATLYGRRAVLRQAYKDPDPSVRLMAVRFSGDARLDETGKPYDADMRRALQELTRRDPDSRVRSEANVILQLPPYGGPG